MKRLLCLLVCLVLLTGLLPVTALADSNPVPNAAQAVVCIVAGIGYRSGKPYCLNGSSYSAGTGFGVGEAGQDTQFFATNCHVVSNSMNGREVVCDTVYIFVDGADIFDESTVVPCQVLYADPEVDLAIIKANAPISGVTTLPITSAESIPVGEAVYALGFPGISDELADSNHYTAGDITVTNGVVSRHQLTDGIRCMAHTASVNHGNSGGPLINGKGQVIGINTFIYTDVENADKRNFAIYGDYVTEALDELGLPYRESDRRSIGWALPVGIVLAVLLAAAAVLLLRKKAPGIRKREKAPVILVRALRGPLAGRSWQLNYTLSIGREPTLDIVLPMDTKGVSRSHCVIQRRGGTAVVTDLKSTYGTFLDGRRLPPEQPVPLYAGAVLSLASDRVQFLVVFGENS